LRSAIRWRDIAFSAQTDRWDGAGPVRNFLDGQGLTGRFALDDGTDGDADVRAPAEILN
jgi:hypothetical protein